MMRRNKLWRHCRRVVSLFLYVWQLPQNVLGLVVAAWVVMRGGRFVRLFGTGVRLVRARWTGGSVSLGQYIVLSRGANRVTMKHEMGHCVQSVVLGPLYLIVIGLPSIAWATLKKNGMFGGRSYYWFYTEAWADREAGIFRSPLKK